MSAATGGLAQSVHTRLIRHAHPLGVDPNLILIRFATERLLYRLSRSPYAERFVLKGALLLLMWLGETIRPTRDADLLGFGNLSDEALAAIFAEICATNVEPDGMTFDASTIRVAAIRPEDAYGGRRVTLLARLGSARIRVQVDVGIGDAAVPAPEWCDYPSLLDLPRPRLRAYRPETVIADAPITPLRSVFAKSRHAPNGSSSGGCRTGGPVGQKAEHPVAMLCRVLDVSTSGYYAWRRRPPSRRAQQDRELMDRIRAIRAASRGTYGAPRVWAELRMAHAVSCSRKRVARLMRQMGLQGAHRRTGRGLTRRDPRRPVFPDRVPRAFTADAPNRLWVAS
ncbi:MAG: nucleotidyl transferase AbiEii/AbiGii toxin family protein [Bacillota bacterium]